MGISSLRLISILILNNWKKKKIIKRIICKAHKHERHNWQARKELYHRRDKEEHLIPLNLHGNEIPERRKSARSFKYPGFFRTFFPRRNKKWSRFFFFFFLWKKLTRIIPQPLAIFTTRSRVNMRADVRRLI